MNGVIINSNFELRTKFFLLNPLVTGEAKILIFIWLQFHSMWFFHCLNSFSVANKKCGKILFPQTLGSRWWTASPHLKFCPPEGSSPFNRRLWLLYFRFYFMWLYSNLWLIFMIYNTYLLFVFYVFTAKFLTESWVTQYLYLLPERFKEFSISYPPNITPLFQSISA